MKNIVLIGFMGVGKSSTGKVLAAKLGASFIDMDLVIEAEEGISIPEIFAKYGEDYFRKKEADLVERVAIRQDTVISTGGGTIKNVQNLKRLQNSGVIVSLTADVDTILERTSHRGDRPVLDNADKGDRRAAIEKLLKEREGMYSQADFTIDTSDKSPMQVVDCIIKRLKTRGVLHA